MTYLIDNPNPHANHFYTTRRMPILAVVVHITAGLEDLDGIDDLSAENTARYAANTERAVSWHSGSDTDSVIELLPPSYTAFHCHGYNSCTYGHEISKADTNWFDADEAWAGETLRVAASHLKRIAAQHRVPIRRASQLDVDRAVSHYLSTGEAKPVGFVAHSDLDPGRRTDPGQSFPWATFLALMTDIPPRSAPLLEEDMRIIRDGGKAVLTNGVYKRLPENADERDDWLDGGFPFTFSPRMYARAITLPDFPKG